MFSISSRALVVVWATTGGFGPLHNSSLYCPFVLPIVESTIARYAPGAYIQFGNLILLRKIPAVIL